VTIHGWFSSRETKTGDLYKGRKKNRTGTNDDGDTKILYAYWTKGEPATPASQVPRHANEIFLAAD
jgi:hypothetical protein